MALVPFPQKIARTDDPDPDWDDTDEASGGGGKMSFLEHLDELRRRLIWSVGSVFVGFLIAGVFYLQLWDFVMGPMFEVLNKVQPGSTLSFIDPTEGFAVYLKLAVIAGLLLASPMVMTQVWLFIAPGLYAHEKKFAVPFILLSSTCFILGAAFAHYVVFPLSFEWLISFANEKMRYEARVETAFSMYLKLVVAFGAIFQMPPVVLILARMGLVTARFLIRNFKYAVLIIFIIAAILTPDASPVTQTAMAVPMMLLYGISIGLAWLVGRKRRTSDGSDEET